MRRLLLTLAFACALVGPAAAQDFRYTPMGQIESALHAYQAANGSWPRSIDDLKRFSQRAGRALDLSGFSSVRLTPRSSSTMLVDYTLKGQGKREGAFAVTSLAVGRPPR